MLITLYLAKSIRKYGLFFPNCGNKPFPQNSKRNHLNYVRHLQGPVGTIFFLESHFIKYNSYKTKLVLRSAEHSHQKCPKKININVPPLRVVVVDQSEARPLSCFGPKDTTTCVLNAWTIQFHKKNSSSRDRFPVTTHSSCLDSSRELYRIKSKPKGRFLL